MELPCALLYRRDAAVRRVCRTLVWGWGTIGVFLGFATRVQGLVVGVGWLFVCDFRRGEGFFESLLCGGLGVGLRVADGEGGLVLCERFFAVVLDVVEATKIDVRPGEGAGVI